ncbi:hypothetical protein HOY82DRAFT_608569 [Tuber indicum]|nr:hypothetical protein HOY82DRAFT_608569 [Tuber indicum]
MPILEGAILAQLMGFLQSGAGTDKDFDLALTKFEEVIHDTAVNHFKLPEESVGKFIQEQIQEIHKLFGQVHAISESYHLWGQTPSYFCKRDIAKQACGFPGQLIANFLLSGKHLPEFSPEDEKLVKDLVAVMENEDSVHDFLDTKPYVDHWGGMSEQDFIDLARRIVIDLNAMHKHGDEDDKFMALSRQERIEDLLDLLKKCKGTLYAMWKMSLYEECLKDPRGMQIRFVDNQKNNWQKKSEGRKRKLRDAEIEEQEAATGVRSKKRRPSKSKPEVPLEELGMEYFDDPRGVPSAPPEKPLARKGVNTGRTSGAPKKIFRGPKHRAIEAIRQANAERGAAHSAPRGGGLRVSAAARPEAPLPLSIAPAQDSAVWEAGMVLALKDFQPAQEVTGVSREGRDEEAPKKKAQEARGECGLPGAAIVPNAAPRSQEYFAAGMNNMEAATTQDTNFGSWDFLLDPIFLGQDDATRGSLDELFGSNNNKKVTLPTSVNSSSNNGKVQGVDFFGSRPGTASKPGAFQPPSSAPSRVPIDISGTSHYREGARYNSTHLMAGPIAQMPPNFSSTGSTTNGIANPGFQGRQRFNFNEQVSGTTNQQLFQAGHFHALPDGPPHQYVNPNWLQNSGQSSTPGTNITTSSSHSAISNAFQSTASYADESSEAAAIEPEMVNEWISQLEEDINGGMSLFPF